MTGATDRDIIWQLVDAHDLCNGYLKGDGFGGLFLDAAQEIKRQRVLLAKIAINMPRNANNLTREQAIWLLQKVDAMVAEFRP